MELWEFNELAESTINSFKSRVPAELVDGYESMLAGGELSMAVEDLVDTVSADRIPVTEAERDLLRRLLEYLGQPTGELDTLNIRPAEEV